MKEGDIMRGPEVVRGPGVTPDAESAKEIKGITENDLRVIVPEIDGTALVLQRNAKDERTPGAENYGALTPEAVAQTQEGAKRFFNEFFRKLDPAERDSIEVLVVASDAPLVAPEGEEFNSPHKRGLETAEEVMKGIREAMREAGVSENQLLNTSEFAEYAESSGPVEFNELEALRILSKSPEFVEHLKAKYGSGKKLWVNYELDTEKETREKMGAEGVYEIAERMRAFLSLLKQGAQEHHQREPGKRLVIWVVSHYDAISPFVKAKILGRPATDYLPVNAGGGITLEIDRKGKAKTELGNQKFDVRI